MKILVIGACGFIGSTVVKHYAQKRDQVCGCDVIDPLFQNIEFIKLNPLLPQFESLFENENYDVCINASGSATVGYSFSNPLKDYELNTVHVFKILDAIRKHNPSCRFINFSSAAVYGNPLHLPVHESQVANPISPYGFHKLMAEKTCLEFYKLYEIPTCSLRVFSVYGPGLKKQIFWDIYQKTINVSGEIKTGTIELSGTGNESRDFIYIDDLMKAIDAIIRKGNFDGSVINVSSGIETTIRDAAVLFVGMLNEKLKVNFNGTGLKGDPSNWMADVSMLHSHGFKAETSITSGLKKYSEWLVSNLPG